VVPATFSVSAGHVAVLPVQVSATSHVPAAARHVVPAATKVQVAEQHEFAAPLAAPRSHCSPLPTIPSPQTADEHVPPWQVPLLHDVPLGREHVVQLAPLNMVCWHSALVQAEIPPVTTMSSTQTASEPEEMLPSFW
jgi:hypothetical protein